MYGLINKLSAVPGKRADLSAILLDASGSMPGCLSYIIAEDAKEPDALWVTEVWDSKESHQASLKMPNVKAAIAKGRQFVAGMPSQTETVPLGGHGLRVPFMRG